MSNHLFIFISKTENSKIEHEKFGNSKIKNKIQFSDLDEFVTFGWICVSFEETGRLGKKEFVKVLGFDGFRSCEAVKRLSDKGSCMVVKKTEIQSSC